MSTKLAAPAILSGRITASALADAILVLSVPYVVRHYGHRLSKFLIRRTAEELVSRGCESAAERFRDAFKADRDTGLRPGGTKHPRVQLKGTSKARVVVPVGVLGARDDDDVKITANKAGTKIIVERRTPTD